jgi:hypothetical protein
MEGSLVAYKVFTNGSTLQASELNENLMQQATAVFSNAAARTAAITSPVEGQMTYLEDTNQYASWNGSSWVSPFGLTLLSTTNITAQSSVTVSNVFTSEFNNYRIVIVGQGSDANDLFARVASSGTPNTASLYQYQSIKGNGGTITGSSTTTQTRFEIAAYNTVTTGMVLEFYNPFIAAPTGYFASGGRADQLWTMTGIYNSNAVWDGINIFTGFGTFTGIMRIYGYKN